MTAKEGSAGMGRLVGALLGLILLLVLMWLAWRYYRHELTQMYQQIWDFIKGYGSTSVG